MRLGNMLGSRKGEMTKININLKPIDAHSLQKRPYNDIPSLRFMGGTSLFITTNHN